MPGRPLSACSALLMVMSFASAVLFSSRARAHASGIVAEGCTGCHSGGKTPMVSLALDPERFDPGATVTATITIQAINGPVGGMYISSSVGKFSLLSGQSTSLQSDTEVTQSAPKAASAGNVVFQTRWLAPSSPGGVIFNVWALSANGNGSTSGDGGGAVSLNVPFGCPGTPYYIDQDGDGYAGNDPSVFLSCAEQAGFSATRGDCNDDDRNIYPGAPERCNQLDDNCNGAIDEGLASGTVTLYVDADADGYGNAKAATKVGQGCMAVPGYATVAGDCNDHDAAVHPNAPDICNLVDDDCNGTIDDSSRPVCGVGACQARSATCDPKDCVPNPPIAEVCNAADDDCDGVIDDGDTHCQLGATCRSGICVASNASGGSASSEGTSAPRASSGDASTASASSGSPSTPSATGGSAPSASPSAPDSSGSGCAVGGARSGPKPGQGKWLAGALLLAGAARRRNRRARVSTSGRAARALATPFLLTTVLATAAACGSEPSANRTLPKAQALNTIAAGAGHTCSLQGSRLYCWGSDVDGQLGDGDEAQSTVPKRVPGLAAVSVSAGSYHSCALDTAAGTRCWGWNVAGQVGDGTNKNRLAPFQLQQLPGTVGVAAGGYHSCSLSPDGSARCWGQNDEGQLGSGSTLGSLQPVSVFSLPGARALAATGRHTCALIDDGTVQCWGSNDSGELGDVTAESCPSAAPCFRALPAPVSNVANATAIATGFHHSCVLLADQSVACFGSNQYGELGNGSTTDSALPVSVLGLPPAIAISAGYNHSCALVVGGLVYCWGWNAGGQLGDGTELDRSQPTQVSGLSDAVAIAGGGFHSCAQTRDGSVLCWGSNESGQLGDGSTVDRALPVLAGPFLD